MIELIKQPLQLTPEGLKPLQDPSLLSQGRRETIAYRILKTHDQSEDPAVMRLKFDSLISHDLTYVD